MRLDRRAALRHLGRAIVLAATSSSPLIAAAARRRPAALIVPLSGPRAALGLSMQRAALLAEKDAKLLLPFDSAGKGGAAGAAQAAMRRGAGVILGPLFTDEVRPVLTAIAGKVPVITFSNDSALRESGAFLLGLSADQLVTAILGYARGRGVRAVALAADDSPWGAQAAATAERLQGGLGLTVRRLGPGETLDTGQADALLCAAGGEAFLQAAAQARAAGVQLLGTAQALDDRPAVLAAIEGAWLAAPDPDGFAAFAEAYAAGSGGAPGLLAGLAYDAAGIARRIGNGGRAALLDPAGFAGVTGAVRFRADGSAGRRLAILLAGRDGYSSVAASTGA